MQEMEKREERVKGGIKVKKKAKGSAASESFHLSFFFFQSIVSISHFPANLEASKIHSTLYLKP